MLTLEAEAAHKIGLTPNLVSLIGVVLALLSAFTYAVAEGQPLWLLLATILFLASGFCDALDGVIARIYQQTSVFGGFLDSLLDRYADAAVYAGIIIGGLCDPIWLAEIYWGKANRSGTRMQGIFYSPCQEKCQPLLGFMLCGIGN